LGLAYLARYSVIFDFPCQTLYLKKGALHDRPDRFDCSGFSVVQHNGEYVAHDVMRIGPAKAAGIEAGDVILSIDGREVSEFSLFQIRDILTQDGKTVEMTLRRGGRECEVTVALRDFYEERLKAATQRVGAEKRRSRN
jgi:serine protease Do